MKLNANLKSKVILLETKSINVNELRDLLGAEVIVSVWIDGTKYKIGVGHELTINYIKR